MLNRVLRGIALVAFVCALSRTAAAQQNTAPLAAAATDSAAIPNLITYSAVLKDLAGHTLTSIDGVTFLLYKDEQGGSPLWLETQNVEPDKMGRYTVQLGATSTEGVPRELFLTGEARWLAVQIANEPEQPRVLLVAVPYALKAADAATIGGLPPSAFVLAAPPNAAGAGNSASSSAPGNPLPSASPAPLATSNVTTTGGTANTIPLFTTASNIQNSILTQTGTTTINVGGKLNLPTVGTATAAKGFNSQPQDFVSSVFNSTVSTPVAQTFQWQAEPLNNDKSSATGTLNLLYASGTATPAETGLKINNKGQFTFATGQTFPGAGTITGVVTAPGSGLKGGGTSGTLNLSVPAAGITNAMLQHSSLTVAPGTALTGGGTVSLGGSTTLSLDTSKVPLLAAANTFTGSQTVSGTVAATAFAGNGASVTNVNAASLGSFGPGAFAMLAVPNNFTGNQSIAGNLAVNGRISVSGAGNGLTFPDGTTQTTHQIVVPVGINDFAQQFGSPTQGKVSYGTLIPVPCWTLPQSAGGTCIIATTVIPLGVTTPTLIVDVQASSIGTASVNMGSTGVAANAAPPSNCLDFDTTQNLTFTAANTMQRFSTTINTLAVCGSSAVAGPGDILVFRICNLGSTGALDFSVTSVEFLWQ